MYLLLQSHASKAGAMGWARQQSSVLPRAVTHILNCNETLASRHRHSIYVQVTFICHMLKCLQNESEVSGGCVCTSAGRRTAPETAGVHLMSRA